MITMLISLLLPLIVWLFLQKGIIVDRACFVGDNLQYFHWISYFAEHISRGVYPLWNPFHAWGSADSFDMLFLGTLNPIFVAMALCIKAGITAHIAFIILYVIYFAVGCLGFYALARVLIGGHWWGWLCYVFLMFSSLSNMTFGQLCILILYVPAVWFFVFFILFIREHRQKERVVYALGASFALGMVANAYIPLYFIVIFCIVILWCLCLAPRWIISACKSIGLFFRESLWLAIFCSAGIILACMPSVMWYVQANPDHYVLMVDRADQHSKHAAEVSAEMINLGGLSSWTSFEEMFTDFHMTNCVSYVPVLLFILLVVTVFARTRQWQAIVFLSGLVLFLLALTDATPLHPFLYKHVYIFHLFRNYFYFGVFIISCAILFSVGQLKELILTQPTGFVVRILRVGLIVLMHLLFYIFLLNMPYVPWTSLVTVMLSAIWFLAWEMGWLRANQALFIIGLGVILIIQPFEIIPRFGARVGIEAVKHPIKPQLTFDYLRPMKGQGINEEYGFHKRVKLSQDESGFVQAGYMGTRDSYELHQHLPAGILGEYIQHKFVLYDSVSLMNVDNPDWQALGVRLKEGFNNALVGSVDAINHSLGVMNAGYRAEMIKGPRDDFKVIAFDLNNIKIATHFSSKKFLVYNDSFNPHWQAKVDGKKVPLYQANLAFKGVWVEPGEHLLEFNYYSRWIQVGFFVLVVFFSVWFVVLVVMLKKVVSMRI